MVIPVSSCFSVQLSLNLRIFFIGTLPPPPPPPPSPIPPPTPSSPRPYRAQLSQKWRPLGKILHLRLTIGISKLDITSTPTIDACLRVPICHDFWSVRRITNHTVIMPKTILIPIDWSSNAEAAFDCEYLARSLHCQRTVLLQRA